VIGAGCVVKGDIPDNTLVVQKKETEFIPLSR
jgi:acetyltransferase-like isoleucine patch superfamily enzyme